jgi:HK97 family phage portal protein
VGLFDAFRLQTELAPARNADVTAAVSNTIEPYINNLGFINYGMVSRSEAMTVPAVARARNIIAGTISTLPICTYQEATEAKIPSRPFIKQPDPALPRSVTLAWILDDLLFYGVAYMEVLSTTAEDGRVANARRVDPTRVTMRTEPNTQVIQQWTVDSVARPFNGIGSLIVFWGPDEGVLARAGRTIKTAIELESAALRMAQEPIPQMVLRNEGMNLPEDQKESLLNAFKQARRTRATAYVEGPINLDVVGFDSAQLQLVEARAYTASEIARAVGIPAWYINAESASSTYSNVSAERRALVDFSLRIYLSAVEARLSQDDITPRGQYVEFELDDFLRGNPSERVDTIVKLLDAGIISIEEARAMEDLSPRGNTNNVE